MDPKKKNIILISIAVVALGYAGFSFMSGGDSAKPQTSTGTFKKKEAKQVAGFEKKSFKKKTAVKSASKKGGLVKKVAKDRQKNTLKKKRGKRGGRKTKKQEIHPAA